MNNIDGGSYSVQHRRANEALKKGLFEMVEAVVRTFGKQEPLKLIPVREGVEFECQPQVYAKDGMTAVVELRTLTGRGYSGQYLFARLSIDGKEVFNASRDEYHQHLNTYEPEGTWEAKLKGFCEYADRLREVKTKAARESRRAVLNQRKQRLNPRSASIF